MSAKLSLLSPANKSRGGDWGRDASGRVVGRIMIHPQAPKGHPWFWTIVEGVPPSIDNHGYAATREQAMADFKIRWLAG